MVKPHTVQLFIFFKMHAIHWTILIATNFTNQLIATSFIIFSKDRENDHEKFCSAEMHLLSPGKGLKRDNLTERRHTFLFYNVL